MGKAVLLLSEVLPSSVKPLTAITRAPAVETVDLRGGAADLYTPPRARTPGIVLVHGANPGGKNDPRVKEMGSALARLGRTVLVPALALAEQRFDPADTARIRSAISHLAGRTGRPVVVLAFSFGAGFTLVALEEQPQVQRRVRLVATVGAYFDLVHLLQGVTTGRVDYGDRIVAWRPSPEAPRVVAEVLADFLVPEERDALLQALEARDPRELSADPRAVYNLLVNRDPGRTRELVGSLPSRIATIIEELSPAGRIERVTVPVYALHSREDPTSPASESEELIRAVRPPARTRLAVVGLLRHVTPTATPGRWIKDGVRIVGFGAAVLRAQEPALPFMRWEA